MRTESSDTYADDRDMNGSKIDFYDISMMTNRNKMVVKNKQ